MTKTTPTLEGQTILVVGGSSGIGFGVALASLNDGAATVIIASSSSEKVHKACERLKAQATNRKKDSTIKGAVIDGKDLEGVDKAIKEIGTINHLVWSSGDFTKGVNDMLKGGEASELKGEPSRYQFEVSQFTPLVQQIVAYSMYDSGEPSKAPNLLHSRRVAQ
jgi:NAD(P)-dependent dehydrogenase (short-subunit alcohol dehydrogenase family)